MVLAVRWVGVPLDDVLEQSDTGEVGEDVGVGVQLAVVQRQSGSVEEVPNLDEVGRVGMSYQVQRKRSQESEREREREREIHEHQELENKRFSKHKEYNKP